ncbi:hypothetical protein V8C42DRAFT_322893 [Trichoderma barbatum]
MVALASSILPLQTLPFASMSAVDALSGIHTYSQVAGLKYDLTFESSPPLLLNASAGVFQVGGGLGLQSSMPAGKTTGWVSVNGTRIDVDPSQSLAWYDRQWGITPVNFTWFQVHVPGQCANGTEDELYSIWAWYNVVNGNQAFATLRTGEQAAQHVVPIDWKVYSNGTFESAATGVVYLLD